jgi:hypothetical protein
MQKKKKKKKKKKKNHYVQVSTWKQVAMAHLR